jgi:ribosomal protein L29
MTEKLDPETKRLRKLSPGELADEVGGIKAEIADLEAQLDAHKAEAVRRELREAEGKLFRVTLSPPSSQLRVDSALLRQVMGEAFVDHFSRIVPLDWVMRCFGRKAA